MSLQNRELLRVGHPKRLGPSICGRHSGRAVWETGKRRHGQMVVV